MSKPTRAKLIDDAAEWKRSYLKLQGFHEGSLLKSQQVAEFWLEVERRFSMEPKDEMEDYALRIYGGKKFALACAVHYMWKRDPKVEELNARITELEKDLVIARKVADDLVTTHGEEMGEKCREVLRLRLLVGKVRKYLEQPDTVLKTRGAILFMLDEAEKGAIPLVMPEFVARMEAKLQANTHKDHWSEVSVEYLLDLLRREYKELSDAIKHSSPQEIANEAADIANFAMMIADNATTDKGDSDG